MESTDQGKKMMPRLKLVLIFLLAQVVFPLLSSAWEGKVVGVSDGDTITVMHAGKGEKIRLYGVDSPEKHQDFGQKAKQFTSNMVFGKKVEVKPVTEDRYGRTVGLVYMESQCLNEELIKSGFAWVYRKYCNQAFCSDWLRFEEGVKSSKVGLWSQPNPVPPWEFRHPKSSTQTSATKNYFSSSEYHGNVKSKVFHKAGCSAYNCQNCTVVFRSRDEAIKAGFTPCGNCKP